MSPFGTQFVSSFNTPIIDDCFCPLFTLLFSRLEIEKQPERKIAFFCSLPVKSCTRSYDVCDSGHTSRIDGGHQGYRTKDHCCL